MPSHVLKALAAHSCRQIGSGFSLFDKIRKNGQDKLSVGMTRAIFSAQKIIVPSAVLSMIPFRTTRGNFETKICLMGNCFLMQVYNINFRLERKNQ